MKTKEEIENVIKRMEAVKQRDKVVAVLEVMWDWNNLTTSAGYQEEAPPYYRINPHNFTGKRLYAWLGKKGEYFDDLLVTNACPQLVSSAKGRGTPDQSWLKRNLESLVPFDLLLVCGSVAQSTYGGICINQDKAPRVLYLPHPAYRMWDRVGLKKAEQIIRKGSIDLELYYHGGKLQTKELLPF